MQTGMAHATVNLSHIGYTHDATRVSHDHSEIPASALPVCVELLAPKRLLDQFIREQASHLKNTTLVLVDGVHISDLFRAESEETIEKHPHSVEHLRGVDDTELQVVAMGDGIPEYLPSCFKCALCQVRRAASLNPLDRRHQLRNFDFSDGARPQLGVHIRVQAPACGIYVVGDSFQRSSETATFALPSERNWG